MTWLARASSLPERPIYVPYVQRPFLHLQTPTPPRTKSKKSIDVSAVCEALKNGDLDNNDYLQMAESLGTGRSKAWFQDTVTFGEKYKETITTDKDNNISSTCNQNVTTFFQSLCAFSDNPEKQARST